MEDDRMKPGERIASILFLLFSLYFLVESLRMFLDDPQPSSYGALPLFASIVMVASMLKVIFVDDFKRRGALSGEGWKQQAKAALNYVLSKDVILFILFIIGYIVLLLLRVGFILSSAIFMIGSMLYLMPRDKKNIVSDVVFTVVLLAFLYLAFRVAFRIVLP